MPPPSNARYAPPTPEAPAESGHGDLDGPTGCYQVPAGPEQVAEADINVEYQASASQAAAGQNLGEHFVAAAGRDCARYPAELGPEMSNTDSVPLETPTTPWALTP